MPFGVSASKSGDEPQFSPLKCRDGSRPNVLLAEDSPAARVLTGALLKRIGCDVDAVEHGEEAVQLIKNQSYDLVLMDIEMPVMDGVVAARHIRTLGGKAAKTPIVALSAFLADTQKSSHWDEFFDIALAKPAGREQLHSTIEKVLLHSPVSSKAICGTRIDHSDGGDLIDFKKLLQVRNDLDDKDWVMLLQTAADEMSVISRDMAVARNLNEHGAVRQAGHKLCGLAGSFAAVELFQKALAVRVAIKDGELDELEQLINDTCSCAYSTAESLAQEALLLRRQVFDDE